MSLFSSNTETNTASGQKVGNSSQKSSQRENNFPAMKLALLTIGILFSSMPTVAVSPPSIPAVVQNAASLKSLMQQGQGLSDNGRFAEAAKIWEQTAQAAEKQGDPLIQALSLSRLAASYQELGQWESAEMAIAQSLELLKQLTLTSQDAKLVKAQALNAQGSLQLAMGQAETALTAWQEAQQYYEKAEDETGKLGSQLNQAQALQAMGLYRRAYGKLLDINEQLQSQPDSELKALGLESLGNVLRVSGDLSQSKAILEQSLELSRTLDQPSLISSTLLSLGNTERTLENTEAALEAYQESEKTSPTLMGQLDAQLNRLSLLIEVEQWQEAATVWQAVQPKLLQLPPSRKAIYAQVNGAASAINLLAAAQNNSVSLSTELEPSDIAPLLESAVNEAQQLRDARAESYAWGQLGHLYEQTQEWQLAEEYSQRALFLAQQANAKDISYQWFWQLGRIYNRQFEQATLPVSTTGSDDSPLRQRSLAAYTEAVNTLQSVRADLLATNRDVQFSFKQSIEPLYRQLVSLLIQPDASPEDLEQARDVIEALQLAELENYFRSACLDSEPRQIDQIDTKAAVLYPIVLPDRLEVILALPNQPLTHYTTRLDKDEIEATFAQFLSSLNRFFPNEQRLKLSQQLYDWLIRPGETAIAENETKTLVFVLDGKLHKLPLAALHDGNQYLIEKYSIALAPGLHLLDPRSLFPQKIDALIGGLSESRQGFDALPGVAAEVAEISARLDSEVVLNQQFTLSDLRQRLDNSNAPVVHLATHGQFSSLPEETFLLSWDQRIGVKSFRGLLQEREFKPNQPIELLVLSACQTADGDERAALGLAGLAVKSGARSTLATLWSVKDESTALMMSEFYQVLSQPVERSKAESLRQGQIALLRHSEFNHPFYWAPFVLVGNWL